MGGFPPGMMGGPPDSRMMGPGGPGPNMNMGMYGGNDMMGGPPNMGGPMNNMGPNGNASMGMGSPGGVGSPGPKGDPRGNDHMGPGNGPPNSGPLPPPGGMPCRTSGNMPGGPPPGNFKNSPIMGSGPTVTDPDYAQQFHDFQQQLYATNTRSSQNRGMGGPGGPPGGGPPGPPPHGMPPMSQGNFYVGPGTGPMSSSAK